MQHRKILVLLLLLQIGNIHTQGSDGGSCRLSTESPSPEVIPWDTKSIKVSWNKVFDNCLKKDTKGLKVIVDTQQNAAVDNNQYDVEFENGDAILPRPPCIEHNVYLILELNDQERRPLKSSKTEYNKPSSATHKSKDLYSGWLETKVVQNICLKQGTDKIVTIPNPPEALKECIKTQGDEVLEIQKVNIGNDVKVKISVDKPWGAAGQTTIHSVVKNIQACTVCEINNTFGPSAKAHNSSHLNVSWENAFQGCRSFEIESVIVKVGEDEVQTEFDKRSILVSKDVCLNHTINVQLKFKNPERQPLNTETVTYLSIEIDHCKENGEGVQLAVWITVAILGLASAGGAGAGVALFLRRRSKKEEEIQDEDENPVYGLYSSDGIYTATEMTDNNETYGVGDI